MQCNTSGSSSTGVVMPSVFVNHGGGPIPILDPQNHQQMYQNLQYVEKCYPNPKAIVVVSAHWEEKQFTILDEDSPGLLFDYYGFPPQSYKFNYPAGSTKQLREAVVEHLQSQGIELQRKGKRGYDHGVFIPLMLMYPKANIPVIQISQEVSMDPGRHYQLGAALAGLRSQGYLIVGSGMGFHHFDCENPRVASKAFDDQLATACCSSGLPAQRYQWAKNWTQLKYARDCHGR